MEYNIYCDESCHLENDRQRSMVLGAIVCPKEKTQTAYKQIRSLKTLHKLGTAFEIKWTKISPAKEKFYRDVIEYFFDEDFLSFRALVIPDKSLLDHSKFGQDHDTWYYKMYFNMLKVIISPEDIYNIYIDIKDTRGGDKIRKLHDVLANEHYDFNKQIIRKIQLVHSHEIELLQLADVLIGALAYVNRGLTTSSAKRSLIQLCERIRWPAQVIENSDDARLKVWVEKIRNENRIHLLCPHERYLLVLAVRHGYILPWTAFYMEYEHQMAKKLKKYEEYKKLMPPPKGTAS